MLRPEDDRDRQDERQPELVAEHPGRVAGMLVVATVGRVPMVIVMAMPVRLDLVLRLMRDVFFRMLRISGLCGRLVLICVVMVGSVVMLRHDGSEFVYSGSLAIAI